jgi:type IV pilus assembly protein PilA
MQHSHIVRRSRAAGFTLIEILIVIGIIAILAAVVVVALNPSRQFAQARNTQRESNVATILNAIGQNIADNKGSFVCGSAGVALSGTAQTIGTGVGLVNLSCLTPTYIASGVPFDPTGSAADTKYTVATDTVDRFTVCAPNADEAALGHPGNYCVTR